MAVIVVREMDAIVKATSLALYNDAEKIQYIHGDETQTVQKLKDLAEGVRYPCIVILQPFNEKLVNGNISVVFPRIIIAEKTDSTNPPPVRYDETFIPILYPIHDEFFNQIIKHKGILQDNTDKLLFRAKQDVPGSVPAAEDLKDYLDTIELFDLQLDFKQPRLNCAKSFKIQTI